MNSFSFYLGVLNFTGKGGLLARLWMEVLTPIIYIFIEIGRFHLITIARLSRAININI